MWPDDNGISVNQREATTGWMCPRTITVNMRDAVIDGRDTVLHSRWVVSFKACFTQSQYVKMMVCNDVMNRTNLVCRKSDVETAEIDDG